MSAPRGALILVPNTLDFGIAGSPSPLQDLLPLGVIGTAASLTHWVVENAKTARALLKRVDAVVPLAQPLQSLSIIELPRPQKGAKATVQPDLAPLLEPALRGIDIGLLSEAGLPAVADPGATVVQAAHAIGIEVRVLPGPSSLLLALAASGLNGQSFAFVGYLPVDATGRSSRIRELETLSRKARQTQFMIETPYRNQALLDALLSQLQPSTRLSVSWALTLPQARTHSATVAHWRRSPVGLPPDLPAVFSLLAA